MYRLVSSCNELSICLRVFSDGPQPAAAECYMPEICISQLVFPTSDSPGWPSRLDLTALAIHSKSPRGNGLLQNAITLKRLSHEYF